jgi:hypothetical protein
MRKLINILVSGRNGSGCHLFGLCSFYNNIGNYAYHARSVLRKEIGDSWGGIDTLGGNSHGFRVLILS